MLVTTIKAELLHIRCELLRLKTVSFGETLVCLASAPLRVDSRVSVEAAIRGLESNRFDTHVWARDEAATLGSTIVLEVLWELVGVVEVMSQAFDKRNSCPPILLFMHMCQKSIDNLCSIGSSVMLNGEQAAVGTSSVHGRDQNVVDNVMVGLERRYPIFTVNLPVGNMVAQVPHVLLAVIVADDHWRSHEGGNFADDVGDCSFDLVHLILALSGVQVVELRM